MTDADFLDQCERQADTRPCRLAPRDLARLCRLAGSEEVARAWDEVTAEIVDCDPVSVRSAVAYARIKAVRTPGI